MDRPTEWMHTALAVQQIGRGMTDRVEHHKMMQLLPAGAGRRVWESVSLWVSGGAVLFGAKEGNIHG